MITNIKFIWDDEVPWYYFDCWTFGIQHPCVSGCTVLYIAFFRVEFRRNGCAGDDEKVSPPEEDEI